MSRLQKPALDPATTEESSRVGYPEPFKTRMGDRRKRRLGEALGLTQFGVNLVRLAPGGQSALRHWHTHEDEFVYVLEGELTLVTDAGAQTLKAGDCAGYPAGSRDAHHLRNDGTAVAVYLEMGNRDDRDCAGYPDDDLVLDNRARVIGGDGTISSETVPLRKDGTPY